MQLFPRLRHRFATSRLWADLSLAQQLVLLALLPATVATLGSIGVLTRQHLDNVTELMRANAQTVALQVATGAQAPLAHMDRRALLRAAPALSGTRTSAKAHMRLQPAY